MKWKQSEFGIVEKIPSTTIMNHMKNPPSLLMKEKFENHTCDIDSNPSNIVLGKLLN